MSKSKGALVLAFAAALVAAPLIAQRGDDSDRPSKNGHAEGSIGGVEVKIDYGRPKVNGRTIWGALVPYGEVWRTGANEATTVALSGDVLVEGQPLAAGTYALFTIPGEESWTVIFNKVAQQWGAFKYDSSQDVLRVEVTPRPHESVEEMTLAVDDGAIRLTWAQLEVAVRLSVP